MRRVKTSLPSVKARRHRGRSPEASELLGTDEGQYQEALEALRKERDFTAAVLETAGAMIIVLDTEGRITRFNRACEAITGYRSTEVLGRVFWEFLIPREDLAGVKRVWEALRAGDFPADHENYWACKDGSRRLIAWSNTAILTPQGKVDYIIGTGLDITDRRKAERALRESEALYRAVGESIEYGFWVCAPDGRNTYASPSFLKMVGLTQEQCSNFGWGNVLHPDDAERTIAAWRECVRTSGVWDIEHRFRGVDGRWHPVLARGVPVRDEQGRLICWAGINLDISRLKQVEEAVRRLNEELQQRVAELQTAGAELRNTAEQRRLALDAADLGTWEYHFQTGVVILDERCRQMWGGAQAGTLDYGQALGRIHPEDQAGVDAAVREALAGKEGGRYHREFRVVWPDNSVRWIASHGRVYFEGEGVHSHPLRFIGVNRDITVTREALEALRESRERLAAFAAATFEGIVISEKKLIVDCNEQFARLAGVPVDSIKGMPIERFLPPEERERVLANIREGRDSIIEHAMLRADGSRIVVEAHGRPTQAPPVGQRLTAVRDITERKASEQALRQTERALRESERQLRQWNLELERRVAERTASLEETISDLEDFSHSITHDLRAPLRAIRCFAQIVEEECTACEQPRVREHLERITSAAARMDKLIQDVLQYSRLARSELQLGPVDVRKLLLGIIDTYPGLQRPQVEIRIEGSLPLVLGNEAALTQCFSNLLGNAVKFVVPGVPPQVRVWGELVKAEDRVVHDRDQASQPDPEPAAGGSPQVPPKSPAVVRIWVEDNGIGIPAEAQERIFKMFQRLDKSYEGTGVGLTVVRKAVEKMGGRVGLESEEGRGSRFWVELELAAPAAAGTAV